MKIQLFTSHPHARFLAGIAAVLLLLNPAASRADVTITVSPPGMIGTTNIGADAFGVGNETGTLTWNMNIDGAGTDSDTISGPGSAILSGANWVVNLTVIGTPPATPTTNTYTLFATDPSVAWFVTPTVNLVNGASTGASISSFSVTAGGGLNQPPLTVTVVYTGSVVTGTCSSTNVITGITNNANGAFTIAAVGTQNAQYYVITSTNLTLPTSQWQVLTDSTNTVANANGAWSYTTSLPVQPHQFFRTVAVDSCAPAPGLVSLPVTK